MPRIIDVIDFLDQTGTEVAHREPQNGPGDFRLGSQVIVRESQRAVFFRDGKAMDVLGPGRHTLSTGNIPILAGLIGLATSGKTPFQAEVVFVNMQEFIDQKWGTPSAIMYEDPEIGTSFISANGVYSYQVNDPALFINKIVAQQASVTTKKMADYLRNNVIQHFSDLLGELAMQRSSVFYLTGQISELSAATKAKVANGFESLGLRVGDFYVRTVTPDERTRQSMDANRDVRALGRGMTPQAAVLYNQIQAGQAMKAAAENPSGMAGIGTGIAGGMAMGNIMQQSMQQPQVLGQQPPAQQPPAQQPPAQSSGGSINLDQVKQAIDNLDLRFSMGEIDQPTYNRLIQKWQDKLKELGG